MALISFASHSDGFLPEDEVYVGAKTIMKHCGWVLLAGQPPRGCDHLPVIEVKAVCRPSLGSKGAFKPDLVAYRAGVFILIECKPNHDDADANKLRVILDDSDRINILYDELMQRHIFERHRISCSNSSFHLGIRGALAHSGSPRPQPDLATIIVHNLNGDGKILGPTTNDLLLHNALIM